MKQLELHPFYAESYFGESAPTKKYLKQLSKSITPQIANLIESPYYKEHFTEILELQFDYNSHKVNFADAKFFYMGLCHKYSALRLSKFIVVPEQTDSDIGATTRFTLLISPSETKKINFLLPMISAPIAFAADTGLPFDYQIFETEEGGITAFFRDAVTEKDLEQVRLALTGFYDKWNTEQEEKIHYIDKVKKGKKSVRATIDFGGCPKEAVIGMIESLRDCNGIKKVVYK